MVNATDMAKAFGKRAGDFTSNQQTKDFINVLESKTGIPVLVVNQGGTNPGTWMHEKLAIKLAGWLNPEFEIWIYDRISELLKTGITTAMDTEALLENPDLLIGALNKLKDERSRNAALEAENLEKTKALEAAEEKLNLAKPIIDILNKIDGVVDLQTFARETFKIFGIGPKKIFQVLRDNKVIFKRWTGSKNENFPFQKYTTQGWF